MTKRDKLMAKLKRGSISSRELRTLLKQLGWDCKAGRGSHEVWSLGDKTFVLATHTNDLLRYQIKQAQEVLLDEND